MGIPLPSQHRLSAPAVDPANAPGLQITTLERTGSLSIQPSVTRQTADNIMYLQEIGEMNEEIGQPVLPSSSVPAASGERTRLEILTALSQALLREVGALQRDQISSNRGIDLAKEIESYETNLIRSALMQSGGRQCQAARLLNVKATTLNAKIKRYRILERDTNSVVFKRDG